MMLLLLLLLFLLLLQYGCTYDKFLIRTSSYSIMHGERPYQYTHISFPLSFGAVCLATCMYISEEFVRVWKLVNRFIRTLHTSRYCCLFNELNFPLWTFLFLSWNLSAQVNFDQLVCVCAQKIFGWCSCWGCTCC